jgi:hypothetical protein
MSRLVVTLFAVAALAGTVGAQAPAAPERSQTRVIAVPEASKLPEEAAPPILAPRTPHQRAIAEVQEQGRLKVRELVAAMEALADGPALEALQRKVEQTKRETRLTILRMHVAHAREIGDLALAAEAQRQVDLMLDPPKPVVAKVSRPAPDAAGGSR